MLKLALTLAVAGFAAAYAAVFGARSAVLGLRRK